MFEREINLIGISNFKKIQEVVVCVVGLGGVGGHAVETLVRAGVKKIILVDYDIVDITNKNRQIIALDSTIGSRKTDVMKSRILDINKECDVIIINERLTSDNMDVLFKYNIDYLIDACDTVNVKKQLIKICINKNINFISCMGTGNKLDPTKLEICDIRKTNYDPLAKIIRKFVKDNKINNKVMVVSSKESPIKNVGKISSISYVPSIAGILCASYIINKILEKN